MLNATTSAAIISQGIEASVQKTTSLAQIKLAGKLHKMTDAQADMVAKDFESMFLSQMMEPMFGESTGESQFGGGETKEIYKSLLLNEYGKGITKAGGIGIASQVKQELLKMQEIKA